MLLRVQCVEGEYRVVLSAEQAEALHLSDGAAVELRPVNVPTGQVRARAGQTRTDQAGTGEVESSEPEHRYMTLEEGLEAFRSTERLHQNTYRGLAE